MARKPLDIWIKEAMGDPDKEGGIAAFALVHVVGIKEEEVHTCKFAPGRTWTAQELARLFKNKAETFAQDMNSMQTFKLLAFYGTSLDPQAKHMFVVAGQGDENHGITEPPNKEGRIMQDMRITEGVVKLAMQQSERLMHTTNQVLITLSDRLEKAEQRNVTALELAEKVILQKYEQEIKLQNAQLMRETIARGMKLLPSIVNRLSGQDVFPQTVEDTALIDAIAATIKPEQIAAISSLFPPEIAGMLMARLRRAEEDRKKEYNEIVVRTPEVESDLEPH